MRHANKHCDPRHAPLVREEWFALIGGALVLAVLLVAFSCKAQGYHGGYSDDAYGLTGAEKASSVTGDGPENLVPWSYDMDGTFWNDGADFTFIEAGSVGLPGSQDFSWSLCASGCASNAVITSDSWTLAAGSGPIYTISSYIDVSFVGPHAGTALMQFTNTTLGVSYQLAWTYSGTVPTHANHTGGDSYLITGPITGSWYRLSVTLDTTGAEWEGDTVYIRFRPYGGDNVTNHGIGIHGVQVNTGGTPDALVEKP